MIPGLDRPRLDRATRARIALVLAQGPWCWPREGDALTRAREIAGGDCPRGMPGDTLMAAIGDSGPSLWALHLGREGDGRSGEASFGSRARRAWMDASAALPRSVPVLWDSVSRLGALPMAAFRLAGLPREGKVDTPESVLDGASFGVSFLLAMASWVFRRPLPDELAASAALDPTGEVRPVDGLEDKIRILRERAPCVRRILVASVQTAEARSFAGPELEVEAVRSAGEALDRAFGTELSSLLIVEGSDPKRRAELVRSFFRLAIAGRGAVVDWTPVYEAARIAAAHWGPLNTAETSELSFARMVAARHEGRSVQELMPGAAWLASLPAPVRVDVVAHLVQQSADAGYPGAQEALELARSHLVRGKEAFPPHLRLLGARGRLLASLGRLDEAMDAQREAAFGWWDRMELAESSYPVSEWLRLCGARRAAAAFEEADNLVQRITSLEPESGLGSPYVRLSRCRALVQLGRGAEAEEALQALFSDASQPAHVVGAAGRWLARSFDARAEAARATEVRAGLRKMAEAQSKAGAFDRAIALADLDQALMIGSFSEASIAIERLREREPGLTSSLLASAPHDETPVGRWIADVFPY